MSLTEETTARIMAALNTSLNAWGTEDLGASNVRYWQGELFAAGLTDTNAQSMREGYCRTWDGHTKPGLGAFCAWIRAALVSEHTEKATERQHVGPEELRKAHTDPVAVETVQSMKRRLVEIKAAQRGALPF